MLFDLAHWLYMISATVITAGLLVICGLTIKQQNRKNLILQIAAVVTVALHFSSLYVDYFTTGSAEVASPMLLPIFPCNIIMWTLLIVAFARKRESVVYRILVEATFYLGIVGGAIGIILNERYGRVPDLADWETLKGLLSHSTMIFGCLYLLVGGYLKIRVFNTLSVFTGLCFFLIDGGLIIGLYRLCRMDPPNTMFLLEPPLPACPWFNTLFMGLLGTLLVFALTALYERCALPREDRWYVQVKNWRWPWQKTNKGVEQWKNF